MSAITRLRAPHRVHILSWALALEKDGSVACHFKDCQFMALSIEEMGNHYPYCSCENSKLPFACELCNRRTDSVEKLLLHKLYSHSYKPTSEESRVISEYQRIPVKKEITPILKRGWEIFLEKKKYLKCLSRQCLYVTDSIEDMEEHYLNLCKETFWPQLKYHCEFCNGRVMNDYDLNLHIRTAHESRTYLNSNSVAPDSKLNCTEIWSNEILLTKQGRCLIEGCQFVDNNVKILEKHYANCNGKRRNFIVCSACGSWLQNESRLNEHRRCFHKDLDDNDYRKLSLDLEKDSEIHRSSFLDEMLSDENDSQYGIKKIMTEESSIETPLEEEVPLWFFEPPYSGRSTDKGVLKDPLALHPSTSNKDTMETALYKNIIDYKKVKDLLSSSTSLSQLNENSVNKLGFTNYEKFLPRLIKYKPYKTKINILRK